ncbi:Predicted P-loop ATPase/GTPase [Halopenitus malekzadehii]|uniref:Predicted P-loop ATPase/GTPase n=1 Tax=Halopenitus malekzadehii TaxID=1267564 RepID=A0A1H6JHE1_9EURY|nr:ATPase [Halopenitus malekzadehii]SEH58355.1 Predicted P-loop ATPase/GTPase [Halopenitus malekzadehii]
MTGTESPTLLVAGDSRVDAGKTTFSVGLLATLSADGADPVGVKPRAGHDFWYDHDDFRAAVADRRLYGTDARRLAAASDRGLANRSDSTGSTPVAPEFINPLHRLWRPTPGRTGLLGEADRTFLCDRLGGAGNGDPTLVVNGAAEEAGLLPPTVADRLPLSEAPRVHDVSGFNEVMASSYLPVFERFAAAVAADPGPVVVESYGDIALPFEAGAGAGDAPTIDAVAVVAPTRVRVYDGGRYRRACTVAAGSAREGALEEHTDAVTSMVEPLGTVDLPALPGDARSSPDRVASAYADAYTTLLEAV